jgi:hypothetical protein
VVHGSGANQVAAATKLSTVVFSPANRRVDEEGNSDSNTVSLPVHSIVQANSQNGSFVSPTNRHVNEEGNSDSNTVSLPVHSIVQANSQNGSFMNADIAEESERELEATSDPLTETQSNLPTHNG